MLKCSEGLKDGSFLVSFLSRAEESTEGPPVSFLLPGFHQGKLSSRNDHSHGKQNSGQLRLKTHLSVVPFKVKGFFFFFHPWSWEEPSFSFSPLLLDALLGLFTKEVCRGQ